ncbi:MAG: lipopolysaccharide heptosyltransferase I [Usitatibacteraceae bacterium]
MRVLLVKLSSLGDVLHNLPVASDLVRAHPDARIDWITEAPYAQLVALHPGVRAVFETHLRTLKKQWWAPKAWSLMRDDKSRLRGQSYDVILDTQGLVKSAIVARWANGPIAGFSRESVREPFATRYYDRCADIPRQLHAVERNRRLAANIFGYELSDEVDYGLRLPASTTSALKSPYAVFLHATSRNNKMWPEEQWIQLGKRLGERGISVILPWGNATERSVSERLAQSIPMATVPPPMSLTEAAMLLSDARGVVGVDTGLAHLAVALQRPTIGLYVTTSPALTGLYGNTLAINLGGGSPGQPMTPSVDEAWAAWRRLLDQD